MVKGGCKAFLLLKKNKQQHFFFTFFWEVRVHAGRKRDSGACTRTRQTRRVCLRSESGRAGADPKFSSASLGTAGVRDERLNRIFLSKVLRARESEMSRRRVRGYRCAVSSCHVLWFFQSKNKDFGFTQRVLVSLKHLSQCKTTCGELLDDFWKILLSACCLWWWWWWWRWLYRKV